MFDDHRRGFRATRRGEQAIEAFREADLLDRRPREVTGDDEYYRHHAEQFRAVGRQLLEPEQALAVAHGEAVPPAGPKSYELALLTDTLEAEPTTIAVGASHQRTEVVQRLGILEPALDAADTAQASNAVEKMLAHQMTAAHFTGMRLLEASQAEHLQPGERVKLTNAASRMMEVFQQATLVFQKLKTGGTQRVVVQYQQVNVGDGGQAVVAGRVGHRGRRKAETSR